MPAAKKFKWKQAVDEAISLQYKTIEERFDFFFNMFATKREKKFKIMGIAERQRIKKKIKQEVVSPRKSIKPVNKCNNKISKLLKPELTISECSLSDTDTSSKFSVNSTNSLEAQAALYKRNNIFRKAYRGRVCEICEKQDDVFKCKGCCGYFHAACVKSISQNEEVPIKKEKEDNVAADESNCATPVDTAECSPKINIKKLSLAEQIDLKMKEIMNKFDYRSVYADSTSESGSSEDSGTEKTEEEVSDKNIKYFCIGM